MTSPREDGNENEKTDRASIMADNIDKIIASKLKNTKEQHDVVGPIVKRLVKSGWNIEQIVFGKKEWLVPKTPSEAHKREKAQSFDGFPCDIAVFDSAGHVGSHNRLLFLIECKQPDETAGLAQLEQYLSSEPHVKLGIFANNSDPAAPAFFSYRLASGKFLTKRKTVADLPRPGDKISARAEKVTYADLTQPGEQVLRRTIEHLLERVVTNDTSVTRREDQLDQRCNLILLKLESDKEAKVSAGQPPFFRPLESDHRTAEAIRHRFHAFIRLYPEVFTDEQDKELRFGDETIALCVDELYRFRLLDLGVQTISLAFQVLRSAALKQGEGQFFTPQAVIEAGIRLMNITWKDLVLDPACGTGGFLIQSLLDMQRRNPKMDAELSRWAQTHVYGIDKDKIGVKLTKAVMQIAGDGSAHCVRGDSVRTHLWPHNYPHLNDGRFAPGRFSVIVTNPPFGQNLKVPADEARLSRLDIAKSRIGEYEDTEIGLVFLQRAYDLLCEGGRLGIILPETYFFSSNYRFIYKWMQKRLTPVVVANVPMEAFQGFCRAKTNFYVFRKI